MFVSTCIPCQMGDHDNHTEVITPAPKGGLGGASCGCKGDCLTPHIEDLLGDLGQRIRHAEGDRDD